MDVDHSVAGIRLASLSTMRAMTRKVELHPVEWQDFKIDFKRQQHFHDPELPLGFARITHLQEDPKQPGKDGRQGVGRSP